MENEKIELYLTGKFEGSAATVKRLITTSRGSINPSFITKKNELARAKDTFHNGRSDSITSKKCTHAVTGSTKVQKVKNLGFSTTIWPPTSSYRLPHSAVDKHEGLKQHRSCYQTVQ